MITTLRAIEQTLCGAALCLLTALADPAVAQPAQPAKIPELGSSTFAWLIIRPEWIKPPAGLRGPIQPDPTREHHMNQDGPGQVTVRLGNWRDPVLKPWAAEQMRLSNEEVISGKRGLPFSAQATCYPGGVPGQLLFPAEPFYFIQTPKVVYMIWQRDHMVRRVYMTDTHSTNLKPSWFGESIGHYENGDTLVIDTIGLSTKNSYIDNYRTPHSEKLHVVERFKPAPDGKMLEAFVKVTDPDTFNEPLHMLQRWRKVNNQLVETVCAENNQDPFNLNLFPMPQADKPDF